MLKGNKGEWSEIYTLIKIISDRKLFSGNKNLEKIENVIFPIIKILRDESNGTFEFSYDKDIVIIEENSEKYRIPIQEFICKSKELLLKIKSQHTSSFSLPEIETFLNSFNTSTLRAKSSVKSDIRIVIHDYKTGTTPQLGFSIKSQLGSPSTLLNASNATNFVYSINLNLNNQEIDEINNISTKSKIKDRLTALINKGGKLSFEKCDNDTFHNNLVLIDSSMPHIISEILLIFFQSNHSSMIDILKQIETKNPLNYDMTNKHPFYEYKLKRFLVDVALGLMPSKVWNGDYDATGGYLIVREDGEVLFYHLYNKNDFEDYLLNNTKLETASSSRHNFGSIYNNLFGSFINLNLQIRFIK
jgi:hypothetical protein